MIIRYYLISIQLLTATMGGCFQNNSSDDDEDKSRMDKAAKMLEEFK